MIDRLIRGVAPLVCVLAALLLAGCSTRPVTEVEVEQARAERWSDDVVEAFAAIPVQDRGRVKPMGTYVGFRMLAANGKRKHTIPEGTGLPTDGERLDPVRWALDVIVFPEQARHYEVFLVNDSAVLEQIGLSFEGRKRRDRYSYAQLEPGRDELERRASAARAKDSKARSRIESQILALQQALFGFDLLRAIAATSTISLGEEPSGRLVELFPEAEDGGRISLGHALERWPTILEWVQATERGSPEAEALLGELAGLDAGVSRVISAAPFLPAIVAPADPGAEAWSNLGDLALRMKSVTGASDHASVYDAGELEAATVFGRIQLSEGDQRAAGEAILAASESLVARASARGDYGDVPLEASYYKADYFYRALTLFLLGFLAVVISWMTSRFAKMRLIGWGAGIGGLLLVSAGVTVRCLLLDRPPVATLYETILFITAVAVLVCFVMERMTKHQVGLAVGLAIGAAGMFLASRYELHEAATQGDTMGGLVAVLNTNFWLATHVVTVTMGYSAGLLAAVLGHVWVVRRLVAGFKARGEALSSEQRASLNSLGKMIYGVICFGLLFSVVGTILGGVWANDSWGRFWGWDPKENGALMIVLYELAIVHARLGGYVKHFGIATMAVLGGAVVAFSWWHVNLLGVGLHSYGFTDGVAGVLRSYYTFVAVFVLLSLVGYMAFVRPSRKPVVA
ncbi:MAG: cytochrome c biogenesis protein CcsA [Planctomycetota bacterium]|nr:cytochrome c biogenesis protein CcsA [Planctomycetota bacterium]